MLEKRDSKIENVVLVGVITQEQNEEKSKELLDEGKKVFKECEEIIQ